MQPLNLILDVLHLLSGIILISLLAWIRYDQKKVKTHDVPPQP